MRSSTSLECAQLIWRTTITYNTGVISGGLLAGTDIDDSIYTNPANGEFSRIVKQTTPNLSGVIGLDVPSGTLPTTGQTNYSEGAVDIIAILEDGTYVLEGDAVFAASWSNGRVAGEFLNLSGTRGIDNVTVDGQIDLNNAIISGDTFSGGRVTGTGAFDELDAAAGVQGRFFGPEADELGGTLVVDDPEADISLFGAFQAD